MQNKGRDGDDGLSGGTGVAVDEGVLQYNLTVYDKDFKLQIMKMQWYIKSSQTDFMMVTEIIIAVSGWYRGYIERMDKILSNSIF